MTMLQEEAKANDMIADYLAYSSENDEERALQEMLQRVDARKAPAATPDAVRGPVNQTPVAPVEAGGKKPGYELQAPQVPAPYPSMDTMVGIPGQPRPPEEEKTIWDKVNAVRKDIARGIPEIPRAMAGGVVEGVNEAIQSFYDVGSWLRENNIGPDWKGYLKFGADGISWQDMPEGQTELPTDMQPQAENFDKPTTETGKLVRGLTQFLTGFAAGSAVLGPAGSASKIGSAAAAAGKGAVADFAFMDDAQQRLLGLLKNTPLENELATWVAEDADSPAGNRVKNMLEGMGLGLLTEGVFRGIKAVRDNMAAKAAPEVKEAAYHPEAKPKEFDPIGAVETPLLYAEARPLSEADKLRAAEEGLEDEAYRRKYAIGKEEEVFINFARIDTPDDIKAVIRDMAQKGAEGIRAAQRGTQSFTEIKLNADQVDAWEAIMQRRVGEAFNAEEAVAARNLWAKSGSTLVQAAKSAADNPSAVNLFAFRKMATVHHAIQQEVIGARTETARALASWRIPVGEGELVAKQLSEIIDVTGGAGASQKLAARIAALADSGQLNEVGEVAKRASTASTWDQIQEALINGMLTSPSSHIVNTLSNASILALRVGERQVAGHINNMLGHDGATQLGEAAAMYAGITGGLKDALRYSWKAWKTGESQYGFQKFELSHREAITSESMNLNKDSWLGKTVDVAGTWIRSPSRALGASDEFFKTLGYRMELHAQAHRMAINEVERGKIGADALQARMAEIIADPPATVKIASEDFAKYATFTNQVGQLGDAFQRMSNVGALKLILPFVRTPANVLSYTMERTPFAPLMSKVRGEIAAGGDRARVAQAQIAIGTASMLVFTDMAMNGILTGSGPKEPSEKAHFFRSGMKPYSIKVGDRYYQYSRFDPFGMQMGIAGSIGEIMRTSDDDDVFQSTQQALVASILSVGNNVLEKSYMQGLASTIRATSEPDRYGVAWANSLAGMAIPAAVGRAARVVDPYMREVNNALEAIQARVPGLSDSLPPQRDLWGRPRSTASGLGWAYDFMSPVASSQYKPEPIDKEMARLEQYTPVPEKKVGFTGGGETATVDLREFPGAYSRYVELAGNGVTDASHYNKGCMDYLNSVVTGESPDSVIYNNLSDGPDGGKADFIRDAVEKYRKLAKDQLLVEFPQIKTRADIVIEKKRGLKMPSQGF